MCDSHQYTWIFQRFSLPNVLWYFSDALLNDQSLLYVCCNFFFLSLTIITSARIFLYILFVFIIWNQSNFESKFYQKHLLESALECLILAKRMENLKHSFVCFNCWSNIFRFLLYLYHSHVSIQFIQCVNFVCCQLYVLFCHQYKFHGNIEIYIKRKTINSNNNNEKNETKSYVCRSWILLWTQIFLLSFLFFR